MVKQKYNGFSNDSPVAIVNRRIFQRRRRKYFQNRSELSDVEEPLNTLVEFGIITEEEKERRIEEVKKGSENCGERNIEMPG